MKQDTHHNASEARQTAPLSLARASLLFAVAIVSLLGAGTATAQLSDTSQARDVKTSGFLGDYSQLKEGGQGEAKLVFIAPGIPWRNYRKILMDPVAVWTNDDLKNVPQDELQSLVDSLDTVVRAALKDDYEFVTQPGPDVMRLRVALTQAKAAKAAMGTVSKVFLPMRAVSAAKRVATGTSAFVGEAGVEAELLDSTTNGRLAAAVDRRVGHRRLGDGMDKWDDVKKAFDHWAGQLKKTMNDLRQGAAQAR